MTNINDIINFTNLLQDVELATALNNLTPTEKLAYITNQQNNVFTKIINQKEDTYNKVYGDLDIATQAQISNLRYGERTRDLSRVQTQIYNNQKESVHAVNNDKNLSGRKMEMNEWTVNNKNDTLFIYSSLFIMLSGLLLITVLWRMGAISYYLWLGLGVPLVIIFILTLLVRLQYTNTLRNNRYWNNKRTFK